MPIDADFPPARPGLPGVQQLLRALDAEPAGPHVLDVVSFGAFSAVATPLWLTGHEDADPLVCAAVERVAEELGGTGFRLADSAVALLVPTEALEGSVGVRLAADLRGTLPGLCDAMVQARVVLPADADDGRTALRLAFERLAARAAGHHRSPEVQVRDVLLQLLSERAERGHAVRRPAVVANAMAVARCFGFGREELEQLVRAAELQDIGLVSHGAEVANDRELGVADRERIRNHPLLGERIVGAAPCMARAATIIRSCYEHYDGTGYPDGLAGQAIPTSARIIAVCVAFHAMTSARPYRAPLSEQAAMAELERCSGTQFDPVVVAAFRQVCATDGALEAAA